jgi:zinc protease
MIASMSQDANGLKVGILKLLILVIIAPTALKAESIELPEFEKKTLLNGMEFIFLEGTGGDIPFLLMIKNGAAFDPSGKWGVTQLMARMMLAGLNDEQIQRQVESAKIQIKVRVDWDAIYFYGVCPPERLELGLSLLSDLVVRPTLDEFTFRETRNRLLEEVHQRAEKVEIKTQELFQGTVLAGSPYSHPVQGTLETLADVSLQDIKVQFRRLVMPNQARLALYYSDDRDGLFQRLSRRWGSWVKGQPAPFTFRQASRREQTAVVLMDFPSEENGILRWGTLSVNMASRDYHALKVLEQYLTLSLPDWAAEISSSNQIRGSAKLVAKRMPGYFQVSLRSREDELVPYCVRLEDTIELIKGGVIDQERFEEAKTLVLREFKDSLQEPYRKLYQLLGTDLCELGLNYIPTFGLRLKRVSPAVLQNVVKTNFKTGGSVIVVAGAAAELEPVLREFGPVEVLK